MPKENNKMQVDIDTLKKQNVNDLLSIKELYKRIEELGEKTTQIKYIDNALVKKLKKEYDNLKKIILDENIQLKLTNDIKTINSHLDRKATKDDIKTINSQLDTIEKRDGVRVIKAVDYGIKVDRDENNYSVDNDIAFSRMAEVINSEYRPVKILLPSGVINISSNSLNLLKDGHRTNGFTIKGEGITNTIIKYNPSEFSYFIYNDNKCQYLNFEDFTFDGGNNSSFCKSYSGADKSDGTIPQFIVHRNVMWKNLTDVYELSGADCNSDFTFYNCKCREYIGNVLNVSKTESSGQELDYSFFDFDFQAYNGSLVSMGKGGNVNIFGGIFIHKGLSEDNKNRGGTFINLYNPYQFYGIQRLLVVGARFEDSKARNSKILYSEWGSHGNIHFLNVDASAMCHEENYADHLQCEFKFLIDAPVVVFDNCSLYGKHKYTTSTGKDDLVGYTTYRNCTFAKLNNIEDLILTSSENRKPTIYFENPVIGYLNDDGTIGYNHTSYKDYQLSPNISYQSIRTKKYLNLKTKNGVFPFKSNPTIKATLPLNSVITKVILYAKPNYCGAYALNDFKVYYNDSARNLITSVTEGKQKDGLNHMYDCFIPLNTNEDCAIIFESLTGDQPGAIPDEMFALIEYI